MPFYPEAVLLCSWSRLVLAPERTPPRPVGQVGLDPAEERHAGEQPDEQATDGGQAVGPHVVARDHELAVPPEQPTDDGEVDDDAHQRDLDDLLVDREPDRRDDRRDGDLQGEEDRGPVGGLILQPPTAHPPRRDEHDDDEHVRQDSPVAVHVVVSSPGLAGTIAAHFRVPQLHRPSEAAR